MQIYRYLGSDGKMWWGIEVPGWWGGFGHTLIGALWEFIRQGRADD